MTPEELKAQKAAEAKQKQEQESQAQLGQQKQQMQEALGELLTPITTALVELQGKYQALQEQNLKAKAPVKTLEQERDEMLADMTDDDRYDKLSNKQMLDVISTSVDSALKANAQDVRSIIAEDFKPAMDKIGTLEKTSLQLIANMGVKDARNKFKDFDEHLPEIQGILNKYPGMEYDDAYLLAKSQKVATVPPNDQTETEKPQSSGAVLPGQADPTAMTTNNMETIANRGKTARSGMQMHGKAGFMALADAAVDKVLAARE